MAISDLSVGSEFAGHRIEGLAGRGGMGVVYKATDLRLKRTVALKAIIPDLSVDSGFRQRFEQESEIAAAVRHPNVITIYAAGEYAGQLYITMQYVDGTDLRALLAYHGTLDPAWVSEMVRQTAEALNAAHAHGLVHRDVKPANVLIANEGGHTHAYLTDFGLTKRTASESGLTRTGTFVGTLDYIAPEQLEGRHVDARADVYALGCVLYHSLTGAVPYPRDSDPAKIWAHMSEPPPALREVAPWVPPAYDEVVQRAMKKDPNERYSSALELAHAAMAAAASGAQAPAPATWGQPPAAADARGPGGTDVGPPAPRGGSTDRYWHPQSGGGQAYGRGAFGGDGRVPGDGRGAGIGGGGGSATPDPHGPQAGAVQGPGGSRRERPRWLLPVAVVLPLLIAAGVAALLLAGGGDGSDSSRKRTPPRAEVPKVSEPVTLSKNAQYGGAGEGVFYMANGKDGTLTSVSAEDNSTKTLVAKDNASENKPFPTNVTVLDGKVWTDSFTDFVTEIDPVSNVGRQVKMKKPDKQGWSLVASGGYVWALGVSNRQLVRIDPERMKADEPVKVENDVSYDQCGDFLCFVYPNGEVGYFLTADSSFDTFRAKLRGKPTGSVWFDGGTLFVGVDDTKIARLDVQSGQLGTPIKAGADEFAAADGDVWVVFGVENVVKRFDGHSGKLVGDPIPVPGNPIAVVPDREGVWVTLSGTPRSVVYIASP